MNNVLSSEQPIKRSAHIVMLSKDHHFGLLFSWKIRQGLKRGITLNRLQSYVAYFWDAHFKHHFKEEEELLFMEDALCSQALDEHKKIGAQIEKIKTGERSNAEAYSALADMVDAHIRFEERVLFPHLEKQLSPQQLERIGQELQKRERPFKDDFEDAFWEKQSK